MPESILEITGTDLTASIIEGENQIIDIEVPTTPRGAYRSTNNLVEAASESNRRGT